MDETLLALEDVSVAQGRQTVLSGVSMQMRAGEIVTIVGPNGSGKSTLLKAIVGALPLKTGRLRRAEGLRIGYVPQKLAIDGRLPLTAARFLALPRRGRAEIMEALSRVKAQSLAEKPLAALSGGQFQRVLIARALLDAPSLLLLDEPTQGLDQPGSAALYRLIEELRDQLGCAILMVSHELHVVMSASDRVICLNGHVCCEGNPEVVASAPEYRALFGTGTQGALALYRHEHTHHHHHADHDHPHDHA